VCTMETEAFSPRCLLSCGGKEICSVRGTLTSSIDYVEVRIGGRSVDVMYLMY